MTSYEGIRAGVSGNRIVVLGAGIVGLSTAAGLAREDKDVLIIDRGAPGGEATAAAAGMLAPQIEAQATDPLLPLALAARDEYRALAARLRDAGHDIGYRTGGIARLALSAQAEAELRANHDAQRALGLDVQWLDRAALEQRQPGVGSEARAALLAPRDGCIDTTKLVAALVADARNAGVRIVTDEACEVLVRDERVTGVRTPARDVDADVVVLAAGAWSGTIGGLPRGIPVEPVRGQMASYAGLPGLLAGVVFGEHSYLVPRGDEILVGSTMERAGFDKHTTGDGLAHLARQAARMLPALAGMPFARTWAGLRPMTPDGLPILGWDPDVAGLMYATGHGRNGILLGPLSGRIVTDLIARGATSWDIAMCSISRFT